MADLVVAGSFQDRIFTKIKDSIGDLMTDEDLKRLVEAAMQDAFFKDRITKGDYGRVDSKPPLLVELVDKLVRDRVDKAVGAWLDANSATVEKIIADRFADGASGLIAKAFDYRMNQAFEQFGHEIRTALQIRQS